MPQNLKKLYKKYEEVISYLFFGVLATVVSVGSFALLYDLLHLETIPANVISWFIVVIFVYFTNKFFVFKSKTKTKESLLRELVSFFAGRILTLLVENGILYLGIDILHFDYLIVKTFSQVVVIVMNYVLSKLVIFKQK